MTPSGTLVLRQAGAVEHPEDPQMSLEENTMPDRHDKNIEKVFPVFGHRFVAKVGRNIERQIFLFLQAFNQFVYCAVDRDFIWGFGKQVIHCSSILDTIIMPRACLVSNVE